MLLRGPAHLLRVKLFAPLRFGDRSLFVGAGNNQTGIHRKTSPPRPAPMHAPTTRSNTLRKMTLSPNRSLRACEDAERSRTLPSIESTQTSDRQGSVAPHGRAPAPSGCAPSDAFFISRGMGKMGGSTTLRPATWSASINCLYGVRRRY
jgi:hypothetical protein